MGMVGLCEDQAGRDYCGRKQCTEQKTVGAAGGSTEREDKKYRDAAGREDTAVCRSGSVWQQAYDLLQKTRIAGDDGMYGVRHSDGGQMETGTVI